METNSLTENSQASGPETDLAGIIEQKSVAAFYQPIISIKKKSVVGLESIGRGVDPENRRLIEPEELYPLSFVK
jgi:EAL domain-containing protein (putative c-di-GMP-specific phosphodiesterase class I)